MVTTVKFSQFAPQNYNNASNFLVGYGGGVNTQQPTVVTWTTATRPAPPYNGVLGFNTDTELYEYWNATLNQWVQLTTEITPPSLTWNFIAGTSAMMLPNNGYVTTNVGLAVLTAPMTCEAGKSIGIMGSGSGGWKMVLNTGQNIAFNDSVSTTTTGYLQSVGSGVCCELLCIVADTTFQVRNSSGNITIV